MTLLMRARHLVNTSMSREYSYQGDVLYTYFVMPNA